MELNLRWVQSLREHGDAYQWYKDYLEQLKRSAYDRLANTNPEKAYLVAKVQGEIKCLDDLLLNATNQERKDTEHARRDELRSAEQLRSVRSA